MDSRLEDGCIGENGVWGFCNMDEDIKLCGTRPVGMGVLGKMGFRDFAPNLCGGNYESRHDVVQVMLNPDKYFNGLRGQISTQLLNYSVSMRGPERAAGWVHTFESTFMDPKPVLLGTIDSDFQSLATFSYDLDDNLKLTAKVQLSSERNRDFFLTCFDFGGVAHRVQLEAQARDSVAANYVLAIPGHTSLGTQIFWSCNACGHTKVLVLDITHGIGCGWKI